MNRTWDTLGWIVWGGLISFLLFVAVSSIYREMTRPSPRDATDPPMGRSGMDLLTDHGTGCQYLALVRGGITPRLGANGQHMGRTQ